MNKEEFLAEVKAGGLPTQIEMPSEIEISEDGNPNVMRPDVMQFLMTAAVASHTGKLRKYFEDRESKGWIQNYIIAVTPVATQVRPTTPAQTFYILNDGAAQIFVELNKRFASATPLLITEDMFVDFETHKLKEFWVYTAAGVAVARAMVRG